MQIKIKMLLSKIIIEKFQTNALKVLRELTQEANLEPARIEAKSIKLQKITPKKKKSQQTYKVHKNTSENSEIKLPRIKKKRCLQINKPSSRGQLTTKLKIFSKIRQKTKRLSKKSYNKNLEKKDRKQQTNNR